MTATWLNTIGLGLGILGVLIIFKFGPPQPSFQESISLTVGEGTVFEDGTSAADHKRKAQRQKCLYTIMSRIGLGLIGVAFVFQLAAVWRPDVPVKETPRVEAETGLEPGAEDG